MAINKRLIKSNDEGAVVPAESFNTVTYTGNSSTQSISTVGFQPDLVWIKERGGTSNHQLKDTVRGDFALFPNLTNAESATSILDFESNGFSFTGGDGSINNTNDDYVAWCWKAGGVPTPNNNTQGTITSTVSANPDAGFSIVKYTGGGSSNYTVGHGLNSAPELIIVKNRDQSVGWLVWTTVIDGTSDYLFLNTAGAKGDSGQALPTDTVVEVQSDGGGESNALNVDYIMYNFHSVDGYQKVGSYSGTGTTSGNIVVTGFEPSFVMVKRTDVAGNSWLIVDNKRIGTGNEKHELFADSNSAESGSGYDVAFLENGFQMQTTTSNANASGTNNYIYLAIA